jgi:hypothetical protein
LDQCSSGRKVSGLTPTAVFALATPKSVLHHYCGQRVRRSPLELDGITATNSIQLRTGPLCRSFVYNHPFVHDGVPHDQTWCRPPRTIGPFDPDLFCTLRCSKWAKGTCYPCTELGLALNCAASLLLLWEDMCSGRPLHTVWGRPLLTLLVSHFLLLCYLCAIDNVL